MQFIGLALTLTLLTGTLVALDLTDAATGSKQQTISQASSLSRNVNALAIMPSSVPGFAIPKADISNGVFAVGSSTGKEGLDDGEHEVNVQDADAEDATDTAASNAEKANDFVLI